MQSEKETIDGTNKTEKKEKNNMWGVVILISFVVFILSQLINVCLGRISSEEDNAEADYRRVGNHQGADGRMDMWDINNGR